MIAGIFLCPSISDFSNIVSKADLKMLAEADEQETVRLPFFALRSAL